MFASVPALATGSTGEVVIDNSTSSTTEGANPEFSTSESIVAAGSESGYIYDSAIENDLDAVAIVSQGSLSDAYCQWMPTEGKLTEGKYEVLFYNIGAGTEVWKNKAYNAARDKYAKYTVASKTGDSLNLSTYYIDQSTVTGETNGWVSLGIFSFTGSGDEYVRLDNNWGGTSTATFAAYTYADKVKFVPVADEADDATLSHIYAKADGTALESEFTEVEDDVLRVRVPADKTAFEVVLEAGSINAEINVTGAASAQGTGAVKLTGTPVAGTISQYNVTVSNGTNEKRYTLLVEKEYATQVGVYYYSGLADHSKGTVTIVGAPSTIPDALNTATYPSEVANYIDPSTDKKTATAFTTNTKGCNVTYTLNNGELEPGWYNVYGWALCRTQALNPDMINIAVNHNGLHEEKMVYWGHYIGADSKWVWLGKYYFNGNSNESVVYICPSYNDKAMGTFGTKFVKATADPLEETLKGFTVSTGSETRSVVTEAFSNGVYYQPLAAGTYNTVNLTVQTANSNYTSIKVNNDSAFVANTPKSVNVTDGKNEFNIELTTASGTENYKLVLYKETDTNVTTVTTVTNASSAAVPSGALGYLPVSPDYNVDNIKIIKDTVESAYVQPKFSAKGRYRVIAWKPSVITADESEIFGSAKQRVEIVLSASSVGGKTEITVDWASTPAGWVDLGVYEFATGNTPKVMFYRDGNKVAVGPVKFLATDEEYFAVTNLEICKDDVAQTELSNGNFVAKATYYATTNASKPLTVILAKYDENDQLSGVKLTSVTSEAGVQSVTTTETIAVSDYQKEKLMAFVWDSLDNLKPIYTALPLTAGN
ncbi:MAG: hypothetical protein II997_02025 [Clostridia bacterium]|nr:hypothetical protein [Clostridia bacterium]